MIWQEMSNIFPKEESTGSLVARHWEDKFLCTIWNIKWFKFHHDCILHSKSFPTTPYTTKSESKRRSYGPDKLEKKNKQLSINCVATKQAVSRPSKLCCDQETVSRPSKLCREQEAVKNKKRPKIDILAYFQAHFTLAPYVYSFFR